MPRRHVAAFFFFGARSVGECRPGRRTLATFITFHLLSFPLLCAAPNPMKKLSLIPIERIEKAIYLIRGEKVMLDRDLAALYEVETRVLNQAVGVTGTDFPPISCLS